ncbi:hypothetical protein [Streptomyces sp. NPDC048200]|uniref:hypothetical protein n=1 Tax=Streptomyces sp. NPDC048200 TaxID=3365512 RepID=UPI00371D192C
MTDFEQDDITAMRSEGDLRSFMRDLINTGRQRRTTKPEPVPELKPPGHIPGAWPPGTHSPGPPAEWSQPKHLWDAAIQHYRNEEHRPDQPCDCGHCPPRQDPATGSHPDRPTHAVDDTHEERHSA